MQALVQFEYELVDYDNGILNFIWTRLLDESSERKNYCELWALLVMTGMFSLLHAAEF